MRCDAGADGAYGALPQPLTLREIAERTCRKPFASALHEAEHPVVRVHSEEGERTLVDGRFVQRFVELPPRDSDRLPAIFRNHVCRDPAQPRDAA